MGLDTSHDCWHGSYSAFTRWRNKVAEVAGYEVWPVKYDYAETPTVMIDWGHMTEAKAIESKNSNERGVTVRTATKSAVHCADDDHDFVTRFFGTLPAGGGSTWIFCTKCPQREKLVDPAPQEGATS